MLIELEQGKIDQCMDAIFELDKLARVLPGMVPIDEDQVYYAVRGIAGRMLRLTGVLMSALQNDEMTEGQMESILSLSGSSQG